MWWFFPLLIFNEIIFYPTPKVNTRWIRFSMNDFQFSSSTFKLSNIQNSNEKRFFKIGSMQIECMQISLKKRKSVANRCYCSYFRNILNKIPFLFDKIQQKKKFIKLHSELKTLECFSFAKLSIRTITRKTIFTFNENMWRIFDKISSKCILYQPHF